MSTIKKRVYLFCETIKKLVIMEKDTVKVIGVFEGKEQVSYYRTLDLAQRAARKIKLLTKDVRIEFC